MNPRVEADRSRVQIQDAHFLIKRRRIGTNIFIALLEDRDLDVRQAAA